MKLRCRDCGHEVYDKRNVKSAGLMPCNRCGGTMAVDNSEAVADLGLHPALEKRYQQTKEPRIPANKPSIPEREPQFQVPSQVSIKSEKEKAADAEDSPAEPVAGAKADQTQVARRQNLPRRPQTSSWKLRATRFWSRWAKERWGPCLELGI